LQGPTVRIPRSKLTEVVAKVDGTPDKGTDDKRQSVYGRTLTVPLVAAVRVKGL
jgi:hypothetical protein